MTRVNAATLADALDEGFRPATAEKVHRLLGVLREMQERRNTADRFTLKGGTALNVFHLGDIPRLSVDIDLMATGFPEAEPDSEERENALEGIEETLSSLGYNVSRTQEENEGAGVTLLAEYVNHLDDGDLVKVDVDLLNRQSLLSPVELAGPEMFFADDVVVPSVAKAELFAQKLVAVAYRAHPRDLFDMHRMLDLGWHELPKARRCYLAYSLLNDGEAAWYRLDYPIQLDVPYNRSDLDDVLREDHQAPSLDEIRKRARRALEGETDFTAASSAEEELRRELVAGERGAFADLLGEDGDDRGQRLVDHPGLEWRLSQL